jgi:hypothetical protein
MGESPLSHQISIPIINYLHSSLMNCTDFIRLALLRPTLTQKASAGARDIATEKLSENRKKLVKQANIAVEKLFQKYAV